MRSRSPAAPEASSKAAPGPRASTCTAFPFAATGPRPRPWDWPGSPAASRPTWCTPTIPTPSPPRSLVRAPRVASRRVDFAVKGRASRWKYARCERVVAVSEAVAAVLRRDGIAPDRVRVVYEGVPDRPPRPGGTGPAGGARRADDALVVGNVAALTDHKDHRTLLAAAAAVAARVPAAHFVIVGDGERKDALQAQAAALGLHGRVVFAGFRDDLDRADPRL